jgi:hypothetical protein
MDDRSPATQEAITELEYHLSCYRRRLGQLILWVALVETITVGPVTIVYGTRGSPSTSVLESHGVL